MKAIGAKNGYLAKSVVSQVFMLSAAGIGAGLLLTYGTAAVMPEGMPFNLDTRWRTGSFPTSGCAKSASSSRLRTSCRI
jgi:ABC-type antimicrobial peptide transport system permease subunit